MGIVALDWGYHRPIVAGAAHQHEAGLVLQLGNNPPVGGITFDRDGGGELLRYPVSSGVSSLATIPSVYDLLVRPQDCCSGFWFGGGDGQCLLQEENTWYLDVGSARLSRVELITEFFRLLKGEIEEAVWAKPYFRAYFELPHRQLALVLPSRLTTAHILELASALEQAGFEHMDMFQRPPLAAKYVATSRADEPDGGAELREIVWDETGLKITSCGFGQLRSTDPIPQVVLHSGVLARPRLMEFLRVQLGPRMQTQPHLRVRYAHLFASLSPEDEEISPETASRTPSQPPVADRLVHAMAVGNWPVTWKATPEPQASQEDARSIAPTQVDAVTRPVDLHETDMMGILTAPRKRVENILTSYAAFLPETRSRSLVPVGAMFESVLGKELLNFCQRELHLQIIQVPDVSLTHYAVLQALREVEPPTLMRLENDIGLLVEFNRQRGRFFAFPILRRTTKLPAYGTAQYHNIPVKGETRIALYRRVVDDQANATRYELSKPSSITPQDGTRGIDIQVDIQVDREHQVTAHLRDLNANQVQPAVLRVKDERLHSTEDWSSLRQHPARHIDDLNGRLAGHLYAQIQQMCQQEEQDMMALSVTEYKEMIDHLLPQ